MKQCQKGLQNKSWYEDDMIWIKCTKIQGAFRHGERSKRIMAKAVYFGVGFAPRKQVKPGFTNYQPRGLANQIKFEI